MPSRKSGSSKRQHKAQPHQTPIRGGASASSARTTPAQAPTQPGRETLVVSYQFDSGDAGGKPYTATVRLQGRRLGVVGMVQPGVDTFMQDEKVPAVIPGTGPVTVSSWVDDIRPGEWSVTAQLIDSPAGTERAGGRVKDQVEPLRRAAWSWRRWRVVDAPDGRIRTRPALTASLARVPAVQPGSYQLMAVLAFVAAWTIFPLRLASQNVSVGPGLLVAAASIVAALAGAKIWYAILHPGNLRERWMGGWAADGFLVVGAVASIAFVALSGLPAGRFYDAAAPAVFGGLAIGRLGCFFTGCCAGRCSASRWAIWSSDRRVGARRIPTQLLESAAGAAVALAAIAISATGLVPGAAFVTAFVAYLGIRQVLLRLREERREFSWIRKSTAAGSSS